MIVTRCGNKVINDQRLETIIRMKVSRTLANKKYLCFLFWHTNKKMKTTWKTMMHVSIYTWYTYKQTIDISSRLWLDARIDNSVYKFKTFVLQLRFCYDCVWTNSNVRNEIECSKKYFWSHWLLSEWENVCTFIFHIYIIQALFYTGYLDGWHLIMQ